LRDNLEAVEQKLRDRGMDPQETIGKFKDLDERRRALINKIETYKMGINQLSEAIGQEQQKLRKLPPGPAADQAKKWIEDNKVIVKGDKDKLAYHEPELHEVQAQVDAIVRSIPNLPHSSVPVGQTA